MDDLEKMLSDSATIRSELRRKLEEVDRQIESLKKTMNNVRKRELAMEQREADFTVEKEEQDRRESRLDMREMWMEISQNAATTPLLPQHAEMKYLTKPSKNEDGEGADRRDRNR
jgi:hypothetical protein